MTSPVRPRTLYLLVAALAVLALWLAPGLLGDSGSSGSDSRGSSVSGADSDPASGLPWVPVSELPAQARDTLELIDAGGPFPYDQDGSVFYNNEGILPDRDRGYYHEYTVETPGSDDRGARRIVAGAEGELYWTEDHYESFERIRR